MTFLTWGPDTWTGGVPLKEHQFQFGGLVFGEDTDYSVISVEGLDLPPMRTSDHPRPRRFGSYSISDVLDSRTVLITLGFGEDWASATFQPKLDDLKYALRPREDNAWLRLRYNEERTKRLIARPRRVAFVGDEMFRMGLVTIVTEFFCPDPLFYGDDFDIDVIDSQDVDPAPLYVNAWNPGTANEEPAFKVIAGGSMSGGWEIRNLTTGKAFHSVVWATVGQEIRVDTRQRTHTLEGTDVYGAITSDSEWLELVPGENRMQLVVPTGQDASLQVWHRGAWL